MGVRKMVYGVGLNDWPTPVVFNKEITPEYNLWRSMLYRCFNEKLKQRQPSYANVTCDESWLVMSKFISDVKQLQFYDECINGGYCLDKDILVSGNKYYSKETCCFVPAEVNLLFVGRKSKNYDLPCGVVLHKASGKYAAQLSTNGISKHLGLFDSVDEARLKFKTEKEAHIHSMAEFYRSRIDEKVYLAMKNYTVENHE